MPNIISQVRFGDGGVYAALSPTFAKVERLFLIDHRLK